MYFVICEDINPVMNLTMFTRGFLVRFDRLSCFLRFRLAAGAGGIELNRSPRITEFRNFMCLLLISSIRGVICLTVGTRVKDVPEKVHGFSEDEIEIRKNCGKCMRYAAIKEIVGATIEYNKLSTVGSVQWENHRPRNPNIRCSTE